MATKEIPNLLPEIVQRIALFLPLSDVCKCMLVCRQWKDLLSSEQFCKRYVLSHYNLEVEEQPSGLLKMWNDPDDWLCSWAHHEEEAWVFSNPPKRWKCGIVHLAEYALETHADLKYKDFCRAVYILSRIQKAAEPEELQLHCVAWGNKDVDLIETCLFPWSKGTLPTPQDILSMFNFHQEMHKRPLVKNEIRKMKVYPESESADGEIRGHIMWNTISTSHNVNVKKACRFFKWLAKIFSPMTRMEIGSQQASPILVLF